MTFGQIFAILRARWRISAIVFATVVGLVAVYTFLIAQRYYQATASVVINSVNPDPIQGNVAPGALSSSFIMTQVDVINSARVALKVVDNLKFANDLDLLEEWRSKTNSTGDFRAWIADLIGQALDVRPSRGSNVITISYYSPDPKQAAAMANAYMQAYLDTTMELRTDPAKEYSTFFKSDAQRLRAELEKAQKKLSDFQEKNGIIVTDERLDVETARLNELTTQYVQAQAALADAASRKDAANRHGELSPEVIANPLIGTLKANLVQAQGNLDQLQQRLGSQNPQVIDAKAAVAELQSKLNAEVARVTSSIDVSSNISASRAAQIHAALEEQRAKVLKMKALRDQAALLTNDVNDAQKAYDGVRARLDMSSLESKAQEANVSPLEYAVAPALPYSPRPLRNLLLASVVGLILAIATSLVLEQFDRRLRNLEALEPALQLPVLAVVPAFHSLNAPASIPKRLSLGSSGNTPKLQTP